MRSAGEVGNWRNRDLQSDRQRCLLQGGGKADLYGRHAARCRPSAFGAGSGLLQDFVDKNPSGTMDVMHRALALRIKTDMASNWRIIQRLRMSLQLALFLLLLELLAWLLAITRV
ncbi:hypothetical protein [Mesorhizobium onobrychidis]|uniref:hypothetical protein n=1 Tax=Mesorhizobium onobrychidis TaxID=2775404 RepID=UPI002157A48C|nr:hypothetical protein [Mesorhizobium onobrychidis]